jgi:hypothetical protein
MRRFFPVLTLVVMAPVIAELLWGSTPISRAAYLISQVPMYGAGALLIREVVRRSERGWASVLLLGVAYGIVEEGLAIQSLFHPTLFGASDWGAHIFGINGVYALWAVGYHAVWSVAIPILLTDLLFPAQRKKPYLGTVGLIVTGICYVLGVALIGFFLFRSTHYLAPPALLALAVLAVAVLVMAALRLLPGNRPEAERPERVPSPWVVLLVAGISGFAWQFVLIWLRHFLPVLFAGAWVVLPMLLVVIMAGAVGWLVQQWARSHNWSDLHLLALASGALIAHTLFGALVLTQTTVDRLGLLALGLVMIAMLILLAFRLRARGSYDATPV